MVELHAARIIDLHATMMEIIVAEARETRVYLQYVHHKEGRMPSEQYFRIPVLKCQNIMAGGEEHLHTLLQLTRTLPVLMQSE